MPFPAAFRRLLRGLILLVGMLVLAYGLALAWNLWSDLRLTLAAAENDARNLANALDEHAANTFGETARTILGLAETLPFKDGAIDADKAREMLVARVKRTPYLAALAVYGDHGELVATSSMTPPERPAGIAEREDFAFHRDSPIPRIFIVPPDSHATPRLIRVTTRLSGPDGAFKGIVEAQVDAEFFNIFYTSINVGTGGHIYLMRHDGATLVEVPNTGQASATIAANPVLRDRLAKTVSGTTLDSDLGIVAYRRLSKLPLIAIVALARDEVTAAWRDRAVKQAMAALAVLALVLVLGWLIWQQLGQIDAQDKALQRLVELRTHELEQRNAELELAYRALEEVSITDALTGLKNRRYLTQHLEADAALALRRYHDWLNGAAASISGADLVFFVIDLDHFKPVNDTYGHAAGDRALVEVGRRLEQVFRDSDYVVRWGGEEFLAVARGVDRTHAETIAAKVVATVAEREFPLGEGIAIRLTCSVGIACYPFLPSQPGTVAWTQVVELADHALYLAKSRGRNTWVGLFATAATRHEDVQRLLAAPETIAGAKQLRVAVPAATASTAA
jgi:diguanylate cyclase (GGDEF)-like protein